VITALSSCALRVLTPVWVQGEDARKFLQGQLTHDVRKLKPDHALLAAFTTAQGRVQTLVTLVERSEGILMLVPPHWTGGLLERMRRMKLRAQVSFDERSSWRAGSVTAPAARELFASLPEEPGASVHLEAATLLRWWSPEERYLLLADTTHLALREPDSDALDLQWQAAELRAGLPYIQAQTRESFLPQQLNLDLLGALSYDKGCYIGQEVVARAKRAPTRRRMYRFAAPCPPPEAGAVVMAEGASAGEVVQAVATEPGCELLAVVDVERHTLPLTLEQGAALSPLSLPCWTTA
jgi:folate-binding protein YgfZ